MAAQSIETLKTYFQTGDFPTQEQFSELLDTLESALNKVDNLGETLFFSSEKTYLPNSIVVTTDGIWYNQNQVDSGDTFDPEDWILLFAFSDSELVPVYSGGYVVNQRVYEYQGDDEPKGIYRCDHAAPGFDNGFKSTNFSAELAAGMWRLIALKNAGGGATSSDDITNESTVTGTTVTAALNTLKNSITSLTKSSVGLGNVDNTTDLNKPISTATQTALDSKADLVAGKVPSSQLPAYVDDVLEFTNLAAFPGTGTSGIVYVAQDTNKTYRWSGSTYVPIGNDLALGETSSTAYRGDRGKAAYDHSQNQSSDMESDKASTSKWGSIKLIYDWVKGLLSALTSDDLADNSDLATSGTVTDALNVLAGNMAVDAGSVNMARGTQSVAYTEGDPVLEKIELGLIEELSEGIWMLSLYVTAVPPNGLEGDRKCKLWIENTADDSAITELYWNQWPIRDSVDEGSATASLGITIANEILEVPNGDLISIRGAFFPGWPDTSSMSADIKYNLRAVKIK